MSNSEVKLPPETARAPLFSCAGPKSSFPMEIGNGALRKKRQNAPECAIDFVAPMGAPTGSKSVSAVYYAGCRSSDAAVHPIDEPKGPQMTASFSVFAVALVVVSNGVDSTGTAARRLIEPFDYRGVTLDPGPLRKQLDEVRAFYLGIPEDDLLKGFRTRAGRPAPGKDLGGWYSSDTFLVFGQIVSGLARLHAATADPACRDKANRLIAEWAKCIEADGYFFASRKPNAPHYVYDKFLWGLLDAHAYCENQDALSHLGRITDWAIKNLERSRRVNDTSTEWYTLSENLYRRSEVPRIWQGVGIPRLLGHLCSGRRHLRAPGGRGSHGFLPCLQSREHAGGSGSRVSGDRG
jgi:hypothetical protein